MKKLKEIGAPLHVSKSLLRIEEFYSKRKRSILQSFFSNLLLVTLNTNSFEKKKDLISDQNRWKRRPVFFSPFWLFFPVEKFFFDNESIHQSFSFLLLNVMFPALLIHQWNPDVTYWIHCFILTICVIWRRLLSRKMSFQQRHR